MKKGFTIVELLIVIVVIAILAAITVIAYNGISNRASESSLKTDLQNTGTKLAMYKAENSSFPLSLDNSLKAESSTNELQYISDGVTYCLTASKKNTTNFNFFITNDGTIQSGRCPLTWTQVAPGEGHTVARASDGKIYAWGANYYGQLGDGTTTNRTNHTVISNTGPLAGKTITQLVSGSDHSLALASDGTVYAWGYNGNGQLGDGTTTDRSTPVVVTSSGTLAGKTVTRLFAGASHSLALASDGTVHAWGNNASGQLGDGTTTRKTTPVAITSSGTLAGKTLSLIAPGSAHTLALASDGTVHAWGSSEYGQIGDGATVNRLTPVSITSSGILSGKTITKLVAGAVSSSAIGSNGAVYTWGANYYGQLGDGSGNGSTMPISISNSGPLVGKTITQFSSGQYHSLALASDGTLYSWGWNSFNQLGDSTNANRLSPVVITNSGAVSGKTVTQLANGTLSSFAIDSNGALYSWGYNGGGGLGEGTTSNRSAPFAIPAPQ